MRCLKPNNNRSETDFNSFEVNKQLKASGMIEAVQVRKAGFPIRVFYKEFFDRFRNLIDGDSEKYEEDLKEAAKIIIKEQLKPELHSRVAFGNSKILLKEDAKVCLEQILY